MPRTVVEVSPGPSLPTTFSALISQPSKPTPSVMPPVALVEIETAAELIPGPRGSMWFTGSGAPSSLPGQQLGDMYLDNSNDHIWQLLGGGWIDTGTVIHGSPDTPADILAKLVTVDGPGSLLDADTLDGRDSLYFATDADLDAETLNRSNADANLQTQINGKLDPATAASTYVDIAGDTMTGKLNTAASAAGAAGLNLPHGAAPSAPVNGDIWTTTTNLSWRQNGATYNAMNLNGSQQVSGVKTFTAEPIMPTPAAGGASIRLPHGVAPSAPVDGDFWTTTAGIYARLNGATINLANTFPEAPTDGQQYVRQSASWQPVDVPPGTIMQDSPPSSPDPGQFWYDTDSGALFLWYSDGTSSQWIQVAGPSSVPDVAPLAQCYLDRVGSNIVLSRLNGTRLFINGRNETIPAAGVTLTPAGLTVAGGIGGVGMYWIYAAMVAGAMVLEASTAAPAAADAAYGWRYKTGDATRTFVGGAALSSDGVWHSYYTACASWFNPKPKTAISTLVSPTTTSASAVELSTSLRIPFINLGLREVRLNYSATLTVSVSTADDYTYILVDGSGLLPGPRTGRINGAAGAAGVPIQLSGSVNASEGWHYFTPGGAVSATNTGTWSGSWSEATIFG